MLHASTHFRIPESNKGQFHSLFQFQLVVEKISIHKANGTSANFYQNKEMQALYNPFKISYDNDTITGLTFSNADSLWSKNFKRALASALQVQGSDGDGAFITKEVSFG